MTLPEIIVISTGLINLIALLFVGWQTMMTRQSLRISAKNFQDSQQMKELEALPKAHLIIELKGNLSRWKSDLQNIANQEAIIVSQIKSNDPIADNKYGLLDSKKLIDKNFYDFLPRSFQEMIIAAAGYYFNCKSLATCLSSKDHDTTKSRLKLLTEIINRANEGILRIDEMLSYLDNVIPNWYLYAPASLQDHDFME